MSSSPSTKTIDSEKNAYSVALLRTLATANVKFVRYLGVDVCNNVRCKAIPLKRLRTTGNIELHVPTAKVVFGGLPSYGDYMIPETGLDARDTLLLFPDISTLRILPYAPSSAVVLGNVHDQKTGLPSEVCCRSLLQKVSQDASEKYGIGLNVGVEIEFCLYHAATNTPVDASNYAHSTTLNRQDAFITALYDQLEAQDISVEMIHAESAPGQLEVVLKYQQDPVTMADNVVFAKETIIAVAHQHELKALFLPKIDNMKAGNGLHVHMSLRDLKTQKNIFINDQSKSRRRQSFLEAGSVGDISEIGQSFMEGILQHLPSLLAVTLPTANSFRRVGQGCWTGSQIAWAFEDKEASLRVVANNEEQAWEHFEYKLCDATSNLYLALACILSAGVSGIENQLVLRPPRTSGESQETLPETIEKSLDCLESDPLFKSILPATMIKAYLALRRSEAARALEKQLDDEVTLEKQLDDEVIEALEHA